MIELDRLEAQIQVALESYWKTRSAQGKRQGKKTGKKDAGLRRAVTGGKHLDALLQIVANLIQVNCPQVEIVLQKKGPTSNPILPGYFRPTKSWDMVLIYEGMLVGCIEMKSHVGPSFGNNYNNRIEESLGNAVDIANAYREGIFNQSAKPWTGYLMILEDCEGSVRPVAVNEPHFPVFPEFVGASYAKRYEIGMTRLVRESHYSAASLILTNQDETGVHWHEPTEELSMKRFVCSLIGHAIGVCSS